jgi:two-component system, LuxR family, sensor kinase FixL
MRSLNFRSHYKDLFENTSDLIHFATLEGDIEIVNPAWLKSLEYEAYEVVGRPIFDFIHPEYVADFRSCRQNTIRHIESEMIETAFITKTGKQIVVEGRLGVSLDHGRPEYTRAVFKDITLRQIAEKKLEVSEKRFKTFFKNAPDAIIVINEHQTILDWNPKAESIFGFKAEEVIGSRLSETIIPPQYREAHKMGMAHFLNTGEGPVLNKTIEIIALKNTGEEFYIDLSISNVRLEDEWVFITFISDITERKKTEESLIRKEVELMKSKLMDEKKDEFISIASHELKTPLTTIKAYAQLALRFGNECPPKVTEYLTKVDLYTGKLNNLINEWLDASKLHAGKLKLSPIPADISLFLTEAIYSMQQITPDHTIIIEQNEPANVKMDTFRLEQVITNLVSNAAKYSPGKNKIYVRSHRKDDEVVVSIKDPGIGISKDMQENIFNLFYRVDETEKQFSGLGIGLFISSEIIKQHGGKIWVESIPGTGTTFSFSLPVTTA